LALVDFLRINVKEVEEKALAVHKPVNSL